MKTTAQHICFFVFFTLAHCVIQSTPALAVDKAKIATRKKFSLSDLQKKYKEAASLEANFVQEVYQASLARTKTSKGTIQLSKPNFIRWEIQEPEASLMVSNGRKVWYFTPDARGKNKGQVIERPANSLERQPLFRILTGNAALDRDFDLISIKELGTGLQGSDFWSEIELKPKKTYGDLVKAHLKIDAKYLILEINIENTTGNKTKISLQNQNLGAKLPPVLYDFKVPPGTEVIKNNE